MPGKLRYAARSRRRGRRALAVGGGLVAALLLVASGLLWLTGAPGDRSGGQAAIGGPFKLVAGDGRVVTDRSFPGKYLLIYFGYTGCRDVCPATLNGVAGALDRLGAKAALVQPLFITIDPARDTPAVLQRYTGGFSPLLLGLTGSAAELRKVADEFKVSFVVHREEGERAGYTLDHSSVIYLIGPDGRFVAPIPADASDVEMAEFIGRSVS